ncbi:MAG TPA: histidine phosphatase family protein [Methanocorpusculum sp.]|nr:histidine phosphatase family protein [Methanocorpusculum sp.]
MPIYPERFLEVREYRFPGLAAVHDASGWYHIDFQGKPAYTKRYAAAGDFSDGIAVVRLESGRFINIDAQGRQIDPMEFVWAGDFRDNIACVYHAEYGATHITTSGELLYNDWYLDVRPFENGKAVVRDESGWKYVDKQGVVLGCAAEPSDTYPRGTVRKHHSPNPIPAIIAGHKGYDACVVLIRHAEREPFYAGEGGARKQLTVRGENDCRRFAADMPPFAKAYASPIVRCMNTAELIAGSAISDSELGQPGAFVYDDSVSHEFYVDNDTISAIRSYLKGFVIPGHYPVAEGAKSFLTHVCDVAEDGKYVLCVTHDAFVVSCIGVVSGYLFENDWMDFLDGCVLFRYGSVWKLAWREGEYQLPDFS